MVPIVEIREDRFRLFLGLEPSRVLWQMRNLVSLAARDHPHRARVVLPLLIRHFDRSNHEHLSAFLPTTCGGFAIC
jgi:hypothetical protein